MGILKRIKHSILTLHGAFEISSDNGLISIYALRKARGEGGTPDPTLEARLADNAKRLKEKQEMAKLVSSANSSASSPVSSPKQNRIDRSPGASMSRWGEAHGCAHAQKLA